MSLMPPLMPPPLLVDGVEVGKIIDVIVLMALDAVATAVAGILVCWVPVELLVPLVSMSMLPILLFRLRGCLSGPVGCAHVDVRVARGEVVYRRSS